MGLCRSHHLHRPAVHLREAAPGQVRSGGSPVLSAARRAEAQTRRPRVQGGAVPVPSPRPPPNRRSSSMFASFPLQRKSDTVLKNPTGRMYFPYFSLKRVCFISYHPPLSPLLRAQTDAETASRDTSSLVPPLCPTPLPGSRAGPSGCSVLRFRHKVSSPGKGSLTPQPPTPLRPLPFKFPSSINSLFYFTAFV